jgi:hypothetical protein
VNIPPLASPAVAPVSLPELDAVSRIAAPIDALAQPLANLLVIGNASIVDLSNLGQLLSASSVLQQQAASVGAADAAEAVGEQNPSANVDDGFGRLLAAAQLFVGAFNQFQSSNINDIADPLVASFQNPLLVAINGLPPSSGSESGSVEGQSLFAGLSQVGFSFQNGASNPAGNAQLTIDPSALESAFNANPAQTSALLTQTFQTIGQLAATVAGQNTDLFVSGADAALPASPFDLFPAALPPTPFDGSAVRAAALQADVTDQANQTPVAANPAPASGTGALANAPTVTQLDARPATSDTAPLQAASIDPAAQSAPAANVAAPTSAAGANAQSAAISALPASSLAGIANVTANIAADITADIIENILPPAFPDNNLTAADTTLQRSLADQALRNALDANLLSSPIAATVAAMVVAETAQTADAIATDAAALSNAAAAQAARESNVADQAATASGAVSASAATRAAQVQAMAQAQMQMQMQPEATVQVQVQAQLPAPLAPLGDDRGPLALDPAIAAAVAAYRLGSGALGVETNKTTPRWPEPDSDINAVNAPLPVDLDPRDGSSHAQRSENTRDIALALAANKALTATELANRKSPTPEFKRTPDK